MKYVSPLLLILLLPALGWAQVDPNGAVTGIESLPPERGGAGIDPAKLTDYLKAVRAADMALQVSASGKTRELLGVSELHVDAKWADTGQGSPELVGLRVRPGTPRWYTELRKLPSGKQKRTIEIPGISPINVSEIRQRKSRIELRTGYRSRYTVYPTGRVSRFMGRGRRTIRQPDRLGKRLNEVRFEDGVMKLDISGAPDLTVEKVTWELNDDGERLMRMHVNFWPDLIVQPDGTVHVNAFGGIEVGKLEQLTRLNRWPPTLDDMVEAFQAGEGSGDGAGLTGHELEVRYRITGAAKPQPFPFTSMMKAGSGFDLRGAVALRPDGTLTTIGDENTILLDLVIGEQDFLIGRLPTSTRLSGRTQESTARLTGTYAIKIPALDTKRVDLQIDGDLTFKVAGDRLLLSLPTGTRVHMGQGQLNGSAKLGVSMQGAQTDIVLKDGHYTLAVDGPIQLERLVLEHIQARDLDFSGRIDSEGTFSNDAKKSLQIQGNVTGDLTVANEPQASLGVVDVLLGEFNAGGKVEAGSTVNLDLERVTLETDPLIPGRPSRFRTLTVEDGHVTANADLRDVSVQGKQDTGASGQVGGLHVENDLTFSAKTAEGLIGLEGVVEAEVTSGGTITMEGLPGKPVLPARTTPSAVASVGGTPHVVVKGDTLWGLARTYGVTPAEIKQTNGLRSNTIHLGQELQIPTETGAATVVTKVAPPQDEAKLPGPRDGRVTQELQTGSKAKFEIDSAHQGEGGLEIDGHVSAQLELGPADVRTGDVEAKILGQAQLSLARAGFSWRGGQPNSLRLGRVKVPVRIQVHKGSRVQVKLPVRPVDITIDRGGSYVEFVAHVVLTEDGARVDELSDADVYLESDGVAKFAGEIVDIEGEKTIHFKGRMVILEQGLDFYGDITVRVHGSDDTPMIKIRW